MPPPRPSATLFEDAIDIPLWLETDRATPFADRVRRDREIAGRVTARAAYARVRQWWTHVHHGTEPLPGARLKKLQRWVGAIMFAIGAAAGCGVALAAFHYDGTRPINVVTLLAVLVLAPLALLLLSLLMIPARIAGLRAIQEMLGALSPGAYAAALLRRLADLPRELAPLFGWHPARGAASSRFATWQILAWSQTAAVAFNLAAIATGFALVTFTDLAFGWSTTLNADPRAIAHVVDAVARPWHTLAPSAVPDLGLIERSQFFRSDGARAVDVSRTLGGWWSFTILAIVTYGLLPRVLLLAVSAWRLRVATRSLLMDDPRVAALLDRMTAPRVETAATRPEFPRSAAPLPEGTHPQPLVGNVRAVVWAGSIDPALADAYAQRTLGVALAIVVEAGARSLAEDRAALDLLCSAGDGAVVVFTRAWEPPLLEFADFITELRSRVGADASIMVTPIGDEGGIDATQRETWARAIGRVADPRVYLELGAV